ncbi:MAG: phosphatidate cytidylyltransferase [Solirubrobacterales bacterium]
MDDLDPPSFQFGAGRSGREEPEAPEAAEELVAEEERGAQGEPEEGKPGLRRFVPHFSETTSRVLVAVPWVVFAIAIIAIGGTLFTLAMIGLAILGLRELFRMAESTRPLLLPAYAAVAGMVLAAHFGGAFQILLILAASFPAMFAFAAARESHEGITTSLAFTLFGIAWMGIGFSHAVLLRDLPLHGGALLIDVLIATFVGDTAAYGAGRLFGSRKITPRISPNKTLEGAIGGFLGATMGFWFAGLYQDWLPGIDALLMGMCVAAVAPLGDLFASLVKRDLAVKDTGRLFGPHGGLIDRLDAVLFTVVAGYYLSVAFVY